MLWEASVVTGYRLAGLDGEIGSVRDFYFDDQSWVIRYLIADTGNWLTGIHISIARAALIEVNGGERHISVDMTREQIERSPVPVSYTHLRAHETDSYLVCRLL